MGKGGGGRNNFEKFKHFFGYFVAILFMPVDPHVNLCQGEVDLELFNAVLEDLEANALKVQKQRKREVRAGE